MSVVENHVDNGHLRPFAPRLMFYTPQEQYDVHVFNEIDVCANQSLDALAIVCNVYIATYTGIGDDTGYSLLCFDEETGHSHTVHADNLMSAVVELGTQLGIDWADI